MGWLLQRISSNKKLYENQMKFREMELQFEAEKSRHQDRIQAYEEAQAKFEDRFKSLSSDALRANNESFLNLAKTQFEQFHEVSKAELKEKQNNIQQLVTPVKESLEKVDSKLEHIEKNRMQTEGSLREQMRNLTSTHQQLRAETSSLVAALKAPQTRGQWGEMQLKRVVEMAGMIEHCNFQTQASVESGDGRLRPDLVVNLPGKKKIVVDAKTPLNSYMEALAAEDPQVKKQKFQEHAKHIRKHMDDLSRKSYWAQFQPSPEFVVLFLPGESFFSAALEQEPALIEIGVSQNVIVATPTTLISLLRAVAYGWQQEGLAENAKQVAELGRELFKRLSDVSGHLSRLGRNLTQSVDAYNKTVGSFESRLFVTASKMNEAKLLSSEDFDGKLSRVESTTRQLEPKV